MNRTRTRCRRARATGRISVVATVVVSWAPLHTQAQDHQHGRSREQYQVEPKRVAEAPVVDGVLDEAVWQTAPIIEAFTQQEPAEGQPASERTQVLLLYDAEKLYVGLRAYDTDPAAIVATEMRRDSERLFADEDSFQIILDTFNDSRSGYMFVTNPLGAKLEQQVFEEGEGGRGGGGSGGGGGGGGGGGRAAASNINRDWDGVWNVAARRTADGWVAEIEIPLVTLRFPKSSQQIWGVNFMRNIRRKNEQVFWAPIPKAYGLTRVSLAGSLRNMDALSQGMDLRIKPFVIAGGRRDRSGTSVVDGGLRDVGLDVKYGVSSGLNLDLTLNTDFAQAEVDEQQVNLTRFPLFFPEKRDFFLENSGQFNVGAIGFDRPADLFFSRRIGLSESGLPIPIIGGARLSGKTGRHNVALMDLQTEETFGRPGENFLVARYSRDVLSRSKVGGLIINKEASRGGQFNRTFAADTTLALTRSFAVNSFLAKTSTPGVSEGDLAFHTRAAWLDSRWRLEAEYTDIQDNFNAEVGFVPRRGIRTSKLHVERNPRPGKYNLRVLEPMVMVTYTTDQQNRLLSRWVHYMVGTRFDDGSYLNVMYNRRFEWLDVPFRIQRDVTVPVGAYRYNELNLSYTTSPSRRVYGRVAYAPQTFFGGDRTDVNATLGVRASSRFSTEVQYRRNDVALPWGAFIVNLAIFNFDYALSPRMTVRSLSQYNSSAHEFSNSVRFNFIYKPGSDLYVVYDDLQGNTPGLPEVRNRQLVLKMTYLLSR